MTPHDLLVAAMLEVARQGDVETLDRLAELADHPEELSQLFADVTQTDRGDRRDNDASQQSAAP